MELHGRQLAPAHHRNWPRMSCGSGASSPSASQNSGRRSSSRRDTSDWGAGAGVLLAIKRSATGAHGQACNPTRQLSDSQWQVNNLFNSVPPAHLQRRHVEQHPHEAVAGDGTVLRAGRTMNEAFSR